jgi:hypothetical protein
MVESGLEQEDLAPIQAAVNALYFAAPRAEGLCLRLAQLPLAVPLPRGGRLLRLRLVERMRRYLSTARTSLDALDKMEANARRMGADAAPLAKELDRHLWAWRWRITTLGNRLAREDAVLAVDEAAPGIQPEERALIVEAIDAARASLAWIHAHAVTVRSRTPAASRERQLVALRRELAAVWWMMDVVAEVGDRIQERIAARRSPLVTHAPAVARIGRWWRDRARGMLLWRKRRARAAHCALGKLSDALQQEAAHLVRGLAEPGALIADDRGARFPPAPWESSPVSSGGDHVPWPRARPTRISATPPEFAVSPDLRRRINHAVDDVAATVPRLEANVRALAALPASAWERDQLRPVPNASARIRAGRRRLTAAMRQDLEILSNACRAVRLVAALAVVRDRNFDAAVSLYECEKDWRHIEALHSASVVTEGSLLRLDPWLDALRPDVRTETLTFLATLRSVLADVRSRILLLPRLPAPDRSRTAGDLIEELIRAYVRECEFVRCLPGLPDPLLPAEADDPVPHGRLDRLAQRGRRAVSRLFAPRHLKAIEALYGVVDAIHSEPLAMRDAIYHHARGMRIGRKPRARSSIASVECTGSAN